MKITKLLSLILLISFILTSTGCSFLETLIPRTPEQTPPVTDTPTTGGGNNDGTQSGNGGNGGTETGGGGNTVTSINVIMVNDNHGMLDEDEGGIDKIAAGISYYETLGDVVKIANGDMFQGTYISSSLRGLPMLEVLNELDFDAFVIGNHEFDWGLDEMKKYKDGDPANGEAEFPFLGANIYDRSTGEMVDWLEPYAIVEFGEIKIGIIGIIGQVETSILSSHVEDYDFVEPDEIVRDLATELRQEKACDVVLVAAHADDNFTNYDLAEFSGSARIDGIFTGHSHSPTDHEIRRADGTSICILQNGGYGDSFATLKLTFDKDGNLKDTDGKLIDPSRYSDDGTLDSVFAKYEEQMAIGDTVLVTVDQDLSRSEVGNEVARSMYVKYGTDYAVINTGGVRTSVEAGEVTYAEIFQVLPFENEVYIVTLSGEMLISYLSTNGVYGWGIDIENLQYDQSYTLAIVDFVYLGNTFDAYRNDSCIDTNDLIRDVFIEYILGLV